MKRRPAWRPVSRLLLVVAALVLAACGSLPPASGPLSPASPLGQEVVLHAIGLIDTGYRFGGRNPEAGLDCSGMVSHIYAQATGLALRGSAADIARGGRAIDLAQLRGGDLVFFNTLGRPHSHVGIYIGDQRFVHAPSSTGKVRIDRLDSDYFAKRFDGARTYFD